VSRELIALSEATTRRFWSLVDQNAGNGCWEWRGYQNLGYGRVRLDGTTYRAHRASYMLTRGEIPNGLVLDHLCRNKLCVNPDHLEPVTNRENVIRGTSPIAHQAKQTECKRGHSLADAWVSARGYRHCRSCRLERAAARMAERRRLGIPPLAKLTPSDVQVIRKALASGEATTASIAREFGVSQATAAGIRAGRLWKHVALTD